VDWLVIKALNISKKELKKKPMNKFLFAAFLFVGTVNAQSSFSLSEAKQYGLDAHLSVKNAQLDIVKAKEQKKEYQAIGLPQVDISASFNNFINHIFRWQLSSGTRAIQHELLRVPLATHFNALAFFPGGNSLTCARGSHCCLTHFTPHGF
jgi:hypothetical protein